MRFYFTILLFFTVFVVHAQRMDWLAHTDCGDLMSMQRMCTDKAGNIYVAGKFKGEAAFGSSLNDTTITKYASPYSGKTFLARYNANGQLLFVVQFRSSEGDVQAMKTLPGGECVIIMHCGSSLEFVDVHGKRSNTGQNGKGDNFFCINTDGSLKWSKSVNIYMASLMEVADDGTIYMYGLWGRSYQQDACLLTFASDGTPTDTLRFNGPGLSTMRIWGNHLLLGVCAVTNNRYNNPKSPVPFAVAANNFAVYKLERSTMKAEKLFEVQCPLRTAYNGQDIMGSFEVTFNTGSGSLWTDFVVMSQSGATRFMGKQYERTGGNTHLVRLNAKGEVIIDKAFDGNAGQTKLVALDDGSSVLMATNWSTAFRYGKDSIVLPRQNDHMTELVVMKLDRNLNRVWWFTGGPMWSQTNAVFIPAPVGFFLAADLPASGTVLGIKQEVMWRTGMYVMRFRE